MTPEYAKLLETAALKKKEIHRQMLHLSKLNKKNFDTIVAGYHEEVFSRIDCMQCGNCCKVLGPRFREKDIKIICKEIGMGPQDFKDEYLKPGEEENGSYLKTTPCLFLGADLHCSIYGKRPSSCADYPYTHDRGMHEGLVRLAGNTLICPAAYLIAEKIMSVYSKDLGGE